MKYIPGVYETVYGNSVEYVKGSYGYDLDMDEKVPVEMIDFTKYIRPLD